MVCEGSGTRYDVAKEIVRICGRQEVEVRPVPSEFFEETYFAPRPRSEMLMNAGLSARGINLMRPWQQALREYVRAEYPMPSHRERPPFAAPEAMTERSERHPSESPRPVLSLLIISWNGWSLLERCLASIRASHFHDLEILVVDNGSTDDTIPELRARHDDVRLQLNPTNLGYNRAVNQGLELVRGEYVLLLDYDTELRSDTMARLLGFLRERGDVSVAAPRMLNGDGTIQETARNFPSVLNGLFGRQSLLTRRFPDNRFSRRYLRRDALTATGPFEVEQVSSAAVMFPRALALEAGPWDDAYPSYWADSDWCMRLRRMGKRIFCVPQAVVVHHEQNRPGRRREHARIWMFHKGAYRFYTKHYTFGALDPRSLFAAIALGARALLLIASSRLKPTRAS
jgi:GT2 family glycosyltransferase